MSRRGRFYNSSIQDGFAATTYAYDALGRLTRYTDAFGNRFGYGHDPAGNLATLTTPTAGRSLTPTKMMGGWSSRTFLTAPKSCGATTARAN